MSKKSKNKKNENKTKFSIYEIKKSFRNTFHVS